MAFSARGEGPAEPVLSKQSVLADDMKFNAKGGEPAGFTMAEILLSLTIIGVVAAITLPSLTGNLNERTWNTQRKALYARFSQAIALMPALNGYGTLRENTGSTGSTSIEDTAAETFVTNGLAKVLKINNICDNEHLEDCGIPSKITGMHGSVISAFPKTNLELNNGIWIRDDGTSVSFSQIESKTAAFETANGESIAVFYNPNCQSYAQENSFHAQNKICANFIYDLNGTKGPNTMGKDIGFITALYSTDSVVVAPMPIPNGSQGGGSFSGTLAACKKQDPESRIPNINELQSLYYNKLLYIGMNNAPVYYAGVKLGEQAWRIGFASGGVWLGTLDSNLYTHCIKR